MPEGATRIGTNWRVLVALIVAALVFVSVQGGEPAQAQAGGGADADERIIGGTAVPNGKYPFVAALLDKRFGSTAFERQFCGGTLIDGNSVLTAAHCVDGNSAQNLRVIVGRTVLDSDQGKGRNVSNISIHPNWNPNTFAHDAAVLKLNKSVTGIAPIKLPKTTQNAFETPGRSLTVAGWGNTIAQPAGGGAGSSFPQRMREAEVPVVSDATADGIYANYVPSLMVAAGKTGKDTCQGDSGGPMFEKASGKFYQVGITSFGAGCGAPDFPGVYAEVNNPNIRNFIANQAAS